MSERIRGLSIGLDLDSADVTKSIWDIRRSFRDLNSSLQTNMNNFKSTERSVSSYTTAMEDLDDAVVKQRKNVDDLKTKYDETVKTKGENSRAAQNLRQEYNRQVDSLNKLESELSDVTAEYKTFVEEQRIANSEFTKLGDELQTAGTRLQSFGSGLSGVGANLTKYITAPIVGATTALAGLTAGLGWKRLMDLDTATASLRGRGYNEEEIARINEDILEGVTGGMATRAEGTRVASGALSAGIAEGEDLQDYIRLVDAATIASGGRRSIDDTAQIFNRIVSGGRMMTQELNMIEDTMPGFSNTMAEHLGVASDEFRKMVTEGEVSSDDFLVVMENFAGDMAEEYANTLPGMLSNARANLGIFGENMMKGVYEETREVVADLLDVLRSDEARELATSLGETIGEAFRNIVAAIRSAIDWYINLDDNQRKVVNGLAMFVVALGPLLTILGTGIVIFGKVATGLGAISLAFGKAGSVSALFRSVMAGLLKPVQVLVAPLTRIGSLLAPVLASGFGLLRTAVMGLITPFISLGSTLLNLVLVPMRLIIRPFTAFGRLLTGAISKGLALVMKPFQALGRLLTGTLTRGLTMFMRPFNALGGLLTRIISPITSLASRFLPRLATAFLGITNPIGWLVIAVTALVTGFTLAYRNSEPFRRSIDNLVGSIRDAFKWVSDFSTAIFGLFTGRDNSEELLKSLGLSDETIDNITSFVEDTKELFSDMWEFLQEAWSNGLEAFNNLWEGIKDIGSMIWGWISAFGEWLGDNLDGMWSGLTSGFTDALDDLGLELPSLEQVINGAISGISFLMETGFEAGKAAIDTVITTLNSLGDLLTKISDGDWSGAWDVITGWWDSVKSTWEDAWESIKESFNENFPDFAQIFEDLKTDLTGKSLEIFLGVTKWFIDLKDDMLELGRNIWEGLSNWFEDLRVDTIDLAERLYTGVTGWFSDLWTDGTQYFKDLWADGKKWFGDLKDDGIELAENLYNGAKEWFMNLPNAMRDALGKVGETIDGWRETLYQKSVSMSTRIANGVITGLNWMIRKINEVANLLNVDQLITPINYVSSGGSSSGGLGTGSLGSISNYSSGTNFHKGGLALVGDRGLGNSPGGSGSGDRSVTRELIKLPNQMELLADGNLLLDLPTGSKVMSNRDTEEELKKRALGISHGGGWFEDLTNDILSNIITGAANDAKEGKETGRLTSVARGVGATAQYTTRKLGDFASDLWSYASNPGQLFEEIFNNLVNNHLNVPSTFFPLAVGGIGKLKDAVADYIGGLFTKSGKADGRYILNKSISHGFGGYNAAPGSILFGRNHYGLDTRHNYDSLYSPVSGHVSKTWYDAMGGNSIQVSQGNGRTWWFMHMNNNAVRAGQSVSVGDYLGETGNTGSFTTGPHLHTQVMQGGVGNSYAIDPFPILNSHRLGGLTESAGLFNLHENEMIVPLNNPTQAMKLIALAGRKLAGRSKQTSELPNVSMNNDTVVEKLVEQNSILMKMLEKLTGIESKDLKIGDDDIGQANDRYSARQSSKQSVTTGRMRYV